MGNIDTIDEKSLEVVSKLLKAMNDNEKLSVDMGVTLEGLKANPKLHNKVLYDKWGFVYAWITNKEKFESSLPYDEVEIPGLFYSDEHYGSKEKREWNECYMDAPDLPNKRYLTLKEFKVIMPYYFKSKKYGY